MNTVWKKRLLIGGISLGVVLAIFLVITGISALLSSKNKDTQPYVDGTITVDQIAPVDKASGKINILLLGVDLEGLRSDTIILASYDLDNKEVNMLSIPRDTRMYVGSRYQKINASHAVSQKGTIKGPQGTIEAVTRLTGVPINYYIEFNFKTFRDIIDALGGVDFYVPQDMNYEDPVQDLYIHLKKGQQHLDGDKAEQLVRFRRYPEGDIARVRMQQQFIKAVAEQKLNLTIIPKIPDLFEAFQTNIKTNFTLVDVVKYVPNLYDLKPENINMFQAPGNYNDTDYGASYWICDMNGLKKIISEEFGYPTATGTIHSSDGSSKSKDVKNKTSKPVADDDDIIVVTPPPSDDADASPSPSGSPDPSASPDPFASPDPSASPRPSGSPSPNDDDDEITLPNDDEDADDDRPSVTPSPGDDDNDDDDDDDRSADSEPSDESEPPAPTLKPIDNAVVRPTANPGV